MLTTPTLGHSTFLVCSPYGSCFPSRRTSKAISVIEKGIYYIILYTIRILLVRTDFNKSSFSPLKRVQLNKSMRQKVLWYLNTAVIVKLTELEQATFFFINCNIGWYITKIVHVNSVLLSNTSKPFSKCNGKLSSSFSYRPCCVWIRRNNVETESRWQQV